MKQYNLEKRTILLTEEKIRKELEYRNNHKTFFCATLICYFIIVSTNRNIKRSVYIRIYNSGL